MPLLTKEKIIEKTLEEVRLCETDYYQRNSELLAEKVGIVSYRNLRKIFREAGRIEELEALRKSCQEKFYQKLIEKSYSPGMTSKDVKDKILENVNSSIGITEVHVRTTLPGLLNAGILPKPKCRTCGEEHDMSFRTGKFCSQSCNSAYSALKNSTTLGDYKPKSLSISDEEKTYKKAKAKGVDKLSKEELRLAESFTKGTDKDLSKRDKFIELEPSHKKKFSKADFIEHFNNQRHSLSKKNSFRRCQEILAFNTVPTVEELEILNAFNRGNKWLLIGDNFVFESKRSLNPDPGKSDLLNKVNEESIRLGIPWFKTPTGKLLNSETQRNLSKERVAKGLHKGWASRGKGLMSYPEKYWKNVLDNLQLSYVQEFVINRRSDLYLRNKANFFCDFLLVSPKGYLINLEIDGKQHNYPEREATDVNRCLELKESFSNLLDEPFYVYRVPWVNPLDEDSRKTVEEQAKAFEDFYCSH